MGEKLSKNINTTPHDIHTANSYRELRKEKCLQRRTEVEGGETTKNLSIVGN